MTKLLIRLLWLVTAFQFVNAVTDKVWRTYSVNLMDIIQMKETGWTPGTQTSTGGLGRAATLAPDKDRAYFRIRSYTTMDGISRFVETPIL